MILEWSRIIVAREAVNSRKHICSSSMDVDKPVIPCRDPETAISITQYSSGLELK
jgi:hypothetical protein